MADNQNKVQERYKEELTRYRKQVDKNKDSDKKKAA